MNDDPVTALAEFLHLRSDVSGAVREDAQLETALGAAVIEIQARIGRAVVGENAIAEDWAGLPADIKQALLLLGGYYYEAREGNVAFPQAVAGLIEKYRELRVGRGG